MSGGVFRKADVVRATVEPECVGRWKILRRHRWVPIGGYPAWMFKCARCGVVKVTDGLSEEETEFARQLAATPPTGADGK